MNQEFVNRSPGSSFKEQKETEQKNISSVGEVEWKNILSIIFLVTSPFLGLILMWFVANWNKKIKVIITVVLVIPFIILIGASIFLPDARWVQGFFFWFLILTKGGRLPGSGMF